MTSSHGALLLFGGGVERTSNQTAKEEKQQSSTLILFQFKGENDEIWDENKVGTANFNDWVKMCIGLWGGT